MKLIEERIPVYIVPEADRQLYVRASNPKYWNGKIDGVSLSRALRLAMNEMSEKEQNELIDPFESLIDCGKYKKPDACGQVWNTEKKIYEDSPEWKAISEASKTSIPRKKTLSDIKTEKYFMCIKDSDVYSKYALFREVEAHITTKFLTNKDGENVIHRTFAEDHPDYFEEITTPVAEILLSKEPLYLVIP